MTKKRSKSRAKTSKKLISKKKNAAFNIQTTGSYAAHRERARVRQQAASRSGRDIAPLPEVVNPSRRKRAEKSLKVFCKQYLANTFNLPWSEEHLLVIQKIEQAVSNGGLFALAMPRGSGKTSLCLAGALWAWLSGRCRFVLLVAANDRLAAELLESIKNELEGNDLLLGDFPEVVYPFRKLEGISSRCRGQLFQGKRTYIGWGKRHVVAPWIPGSKAAGSVIQSSGIEACLRGTRHTCPDGTVIRPDLVLLDDPQTDESAKSPAQTYARERLIVGAILGLSGPDKRLAAICPCTIICPGDLADRLTDPKVYPEWQGVRTKMLISFPDNMEIWDEYNEQRILSLSKYGDLRLANAFYRKHRKELDKGAVVSWKHRKTKDEVSAIQHAMNLYFRDQQAFWAEYQNEPKVDDIRARYRWSASEIASRMGETERGVVPDSVALTCGVDVQERLLYWVVVAWNEKGGGVVIDYGTTPRLRRNYFVLRDIRKTLAQHYKVTSLGDGVLSALKEFGADVISRAWQDEHGAQHSISLTLVDAGWGAATEYVHACSRQQPWAGRVMPCYGRFVGASRKPISEYKRKRGERSGQEWIITTNHQRKTRYVLFDANYWKTWIADRLQVPVNDRGALLLYKANALEHRLLADHTTAEYATLVEADGRQVVEWNLRPEHPDNHFWDCLVMAAVAASIVHPFKTEQEQKPRRRRPRILVKE